MLVHLRLVTPDDLTSRARDLLVDDTRVANVTVLQGASQDPPGDLVEADVAREASDEILDRLEEMGVSARGGVTLFDPSATPFDAAHRIEKAAGGDSDDTVVWDVVVEQAEESAQVSVTYYVFLALATALAGVAVITDSPVLVVGAMVVGPDFGPVAAICTGIAVRRWRLALRAALLLVSGYAAAIVTVALCALAARAAGGLTPERVLSDHPLTHFIWNPDGWAFAVAVIAGAAGVLATTTSKSTTLVGVFISVTTVPAAGSLAVSLATGATQQALGSAAQLGVNVAGMLVSGIVVLLLQRVVVRRWNLRSTGIAR